MKLICGKNAYAVLQEFSDVVSVFIPEIKPCINFKQENRHHCFDVYTHTLKAVEKSSQNSIIRLALFFHDIGKPSLAHFDVEFNDAELNLIFFSFAKRENAVASMIVSNKTFFINSLLFKKKF